MSTARQPKGVPVGGQFAGATRSPSPVTLTKLSKATQRKVAAEGVDAGQKNGERKRAGSTVLHTNPENLFARIATVEQLDAQYEHAMSPENLSQDGGRSVSMQRAVANSIHHEYTERRLELAEASNAVDWEYGEALKLGTLELGQPRIVPATLHRIEGVEDIAVTKVQQGVANMLVKIEYTLEDPEDVLDQLNVDRSADIPAARGALETALEERFGLETSRKLDGPPGDGLDVTDGKIVVTQHESYRTVRQGGNKVDKTIDKEDLSDWAGALTVELREARSVEEIRDRFHEELRGWGDE